MTRRQEEQQKDNFVCGNCDEFFEAHSDCLSTSAGASVWKESGGQKVPAHEIVFAVTYIHSSPALLW